MNKVALIGIGKFGLRHLESLVQSSIPLTIEVVDCNPAAIANTKALLENDARVQSHVSVKYLTDLNDLSPKTDLVIIATSSNERAGITKQLLATKQIANIIFEKVLFTKIEDYNEVKNLLDQKKVNAWVNCPRRMYPIYQEIKLLFKSNENINLVLQGGCVGIGSNAIHILDLLSFLNDCYTYTFDLSALDNTLLPSSRPGYYEPTGTLRAFQPNGSEFILHSRSSTPIPHMITIISDDVKAFLDEKGGFIRYALKENNWEWETKTFTLPFQSTLTSLVAEDIIKNNTCCLTSFSDSSQIHIPMLNAFTPHISNIIGKELDHCPIT